MGLIKELDDQLGRLFRYLEESGQIESTMIVFCSDHGDNMGDHWMGEKDLFHDCSARVPLIISDPRPIADASRGRSTDALVEGIDLTPTFLDFFGAPPRPHIVEGKSLQPLLTGQAETLRPYCVSEYDYSTRDARRALGVDQADARTVMIFDGRWKYVHIETMRAMLFDLETDPNELTDLGADPAYADQVERLAALHFEWTRAHHNRITRSAEIVEKMTDNKEPPGILIGFANVDELTLENRSLPKHTRR